jgi:hypothetical protein
MAGGRGGRWMTGLWARAIAAPVLSRFVSQKPVRFLARPGKEDLTTTHEFMKSEKVTPVIDKRYRLNEVSEAIRYLEEGQARGKVVITLQSVTPPDHVLHPTLRAGLRDFPVRKSEKSIESAPLLFAMSQVSHGTYSRSL